MYVHICSLVLDGVGCHFIPVDFSWKKIFFSYKHKITTKKGSDDNEGDADRK